MKLKGAAAISVALHTTLIVLAVVNLGFLNRDKGIKIGNPGEGGAATVTLTAGIPLPKAPTESVLATDTKTLNPAELPSKKEIAKPEPPTQGKAYEILDPKKKNRQDLAAMVQNDLKNAQ